MIFIILSVVLAFIAVLIYLTSASKHGALLELKNDVKSSFPAVLSNIEDVVFSWNDCVCMFTSQIEKLRHNDLCI